MLHIYTQFIPLVMFVVIFVFKSAQCKFCLMDEWIYVHSCAVGIIAKRFSDQEKSH